MRPASRLDYPAVRQNDAYQGASQAPHDAGTDQPTRPPHAINTRELRRDLAILLAVSAFASLIFFFNLGRYGLWEPDEARYAEIAREMLALHDFIVPHLNYVPYLEKPPMLYWLTAVSMLTFGINEFAARLPGALAALLGVIATYWFVLRAFDRRRALLAALVLATSGLYAVMAQVLTTDMLLTATITVALFAFYLQWREGGRWWLLLYLAAALATLTKGPVGIVIPALAGLIFLWWEGQLSGAIRRFHALRGILIVAALTLPWFAAIMLRQPGFFDYFVIDENIRRFFQAGYSHREPLYYYLPVIAAGMLPWTLALPFLPWRSLAANPARRFCLIAAAVVIGFFSLASAKLVPYVLPAFPPLAVLIADAFMTFADRDAARPSDAAPRDALPDPRRLAAIGPLLGAAGSGTILIAFGPRLFARPDLFLMIRPALYLGGVIMIVGGLGCFVAFWMRQLFAGLAVLVTATLLMLMVVSYGRILAEPTRSYAQIAREIARRSHGAILVCYPRYIQSLPFYCGRRVILVGAKTELAYGADHAPDAANYFFTSRKDLMRLWNQPQPTVLIIDRWALPPIQSALGPYRVIASDAKKLAIMPLRAH
jgi:4-amino-4-deoxy-L-arabinose transferase-like glycosyltransferase